MAEPSGIERRKHRRVKADIAVAIEREDAAIVVAYAVDVSVGGMRFQFLGPGLNFESGEVVRLNLKFGEVDATADGKIVRIRELDDSATELALSFVDLPAETLTLLEEQIEDGAEVQFGT